MPDIVNVYPSGAACAAAALPISPPAPARFSTKQRSRSISDKCSHTRRPNMSAAPPGVDGAMMRSGRAIIDAIKEARVEFILSVPDIVTSEGVLRPITRDPQLRLVRVAKEDECIGIASGLHYCGKRALSLIQYTGLLDSLNALRGVA